ncbi:MAG TPA: hypothetical protein PKD83_11240 [Ignavibacteria bacterium]|nr:hypothetical protein [Ignavibacteria bacterium]
MKTLIINSLAILIFLFTGSASYSQSDSGIIYYMNDIKLNYENGIMVNTSMETGQKTFIPNLVSVADINKIRFLSDSLINISYDQKSDLKLEINKIRQVSIKSGSYSLVGTFIGIAAGVLAGGLIGYALGKSTEEDNPVKGWFYIDPGAIGAVFGIPVGAIIGGIIGGNIGANIDSYDTFYMRKNSLDKKSELKRILRIDKNKNNRKH